MTYVSLVLQESVQVALLISALNYLGVFYANVQNAYLNAPPREKAWFQARTEFGKYGDRVIIIICALYGMSSIAASWIYMISKTMIYFVFTPCLADPDV